METENPRGGIAENFGRIQRGNYSKILENQDISGGDRGSHQMSLGGITSVK